MSRPIREKSLDGVSSSGVGSVHNAKGHNSLGLFVVASNLDAGSDTLDIQLEVQGPDGEWAPIRNETGTKVGALSASDFSDLDGDGTTFNAMLYVHGVPAPKLRANITSFSDAASSDLSVDAYVLAANNGGTGHGFYQS